jgi:hypothetical protein
MVTNEMPPAVISSTGDSVCSKRAAGAITYHGTVIYDIYGTNSSAAAAAVASVS